MYNPPKRARTAQSGACSYCVEQRERCYIGVRGIPCSNCRRLNLTCNGTASPEVQAKKRLPSATYCARGLFASQIRETKHEHLPRKNSIPAVAATDPLDNYISIVHQLLGPESLEPPISIDIPDYVSGLPNRLELVDLEYLENKGALCLPTSQFRKELLRSYILWVHPQVPVLDLEIFLRTIAVNNGDRSISLLLFHAVMFAASAFVDISHIHNEGYTSRKAARDVLFRRAKTLLELDCEDDRLSTVQALLLLIHWNDLPDAEKDASHWMGICSSLAMSIGLHHSPDNTAAMTPSQRQTWRRTWWSLYNHARLTAEDLLSMMSIEEDRGDSELIYMTMVTLNDFQFGVYSPEARAIVDDCEVLRTIEYQKSQALVFIEKTRLCRLAQFSRVSNQVSKLIHETDSPETKLSSKRNNLHPGEAGDLHRWLSQLPSNTQHQYPLALIPTEWERSIYLHRTWLRLLYLGSAYVACCDELRAAGNPFLDPFLDPMICPRSGLMDQYILDITDLFDEIDSLGLTKHLPSPSTALLILVLTFHRRLVDTGTPLEQVTSARALHKCWKMMHKLQETSKLGVQMIALVRDTVRTDIWDQLSSKLLSS